MSQLTKQMLWQAALERGSAGSSLPRASLSVRFRTQLLTVMLIYNIDYVANVECTIYQLLYAIDVLSFKIKYLFWNPPE